MNKSLGVFRTNSLGEAMQWANSQASSSVEILEVSPVGKSALVLLHGNFGKIDWATWGPRAVLIENPHDQLLSGYLSYDNAKISKFFVVFESSEPAQIFKAAQEGLKIGMQVVDFRILRTEGSPSYLMMTAEAAKDVSKFNYVKTTVVDQPGESLRQFLDVAPQ